MACGITDTSIVCVPIFSNSQLMSVIKNNNVPIYKRFCMSCHAKQWSVMMSTYTNEAKPISTW